MTGCVQRPWAHIGGSRNVIASACPTHGLLPLSSLTARPTKGGRMLTPLSKAGQLWPVSQSETDVSIKGNITAGQLTTRTMRQCPPREQRQRDCAGPRLPGLHGLGFRGCRLVLPASLRAWLSVPCHPARFLVSNQPRDPTLESWAVCLAPLEGGRRQ